MFIYLVVGIGMVEVKVEIGVVSISAFCMVDFCY